MSLPLAMSCGDPGGVGVEIAIAAWLRRRQQDIPPFYLLADPALVSARARLAGLDLRMAESGPEAAVERFAECLPVVPLANRSIDLAGKPDARNAAGIIEAIDRAVSHVQTGLARAVVTLPIAKIALHEAGFRFPGHTEYLAHLAGQNSGQNVMPVMMLAGPMLRTVPVTIHVALADVPRLLTKDLLIETARIVERDLRTRFGLKKPRLAAAGLNPHAGEKGAFGTEEERVILPAISQLRSEGIDIAGPLPADTMFHPQARGEYDAALCMYHDQALIPVKTLDFERTVNVTLGLPFVRTSPDHGTAFDLAGTGRASAESLIASLRLADELSNNKAAAT